MGWVGRDALGVLKELTMTPRVRRSGVHHGQRDGDEPEPAVPADLWSKDATN